MEATITGKQAQQEVARQVRALLTALSTHLEAWAWEKRWNAVDIAMLRFWLNEAIIAAEQAMELDVEKIME